MCGAAPLSAELTQQAVKILPHVDIGQGYGLFNLILTNSSLTLSWVGMTETCTTVTFPRLDEKVGTLGSAGQLMPGVIARVVKENGSLAKLGEQGELYVKSPSIALRYLNNEEAYVVVTLFKFIATHM